MPLPRLIDIVSTSSSGQVGDSPVGAFALAINRDGSLIGFHSDSDKLFSPNPPGEADYVIKNMNTGAIKAISIAADGILTGGRSGGAINAYDELAFSADGAVQAFGSTKLLTSSSDTTGEDVFLRDSGSLIMASVLQGGSTHTLSGTPDLSDNGMFVVFQSSDNLLNPIDNNGSGGTDIFLYDKSANKLALVTGNADGSAQATNNGNETDSLNASVSNDGRFVVFQTTSSSLVPGDTNNYSDIYLRDMVSNNTYIVSITPTGGVANSSSSDPAMTPDEHYVVYSSSASNLVENDDFGNDVFRTDLNSGVTRKINTTADGVAVDGAFHAQISADGRYAVFESTATKLVPMAGDSSVVNKVFVKDMKTGSIAVASIDTNGRVNDKSAYAPQISDDGQFIVFTTASALVSGDSNGINDVYRVSNPVYGLGSNLNNDVFTDSPEAEVWNGADGLDTVVYTGRSVDHLLQKQSSGYLLDSDSLSSIERLQFWDKSLALDVGNTGNAGQAMEFIGVVAPTLLNDLSIRGLIISLFDQENSMAALSQLALDLNLLPHANSTELANAVYQNVIGSTATQEMTNALVDYINVNGQANFVAAVAGLAINVDLVGLSQSGLEFI